MNANLGRTPNASNPGYICRRLTTVPSLTALHIHNPRRYPHLLASVTRASPRARYDILFAFPGDTLTLAADQQIYRNGRSSGAGDFLGLIDSEWRAHAIATGDNSASCAPAPPFTGGWFVFLGYELVSQIEPAVAGISPDAAFPVAFATRFPAAVIIDHVQRQTLLVCESDRSAEILPELEQDLQHRPAWDTAVPAIASIQEDEPARFLQDLRRVQEYIRAGDVFQVNLSRLWRISLRTGIGAPEIFRQLCTANPAPFAGMLTWSNDRAVICSSPERLVEVRGKEIRTRPIAGTYPRSLDPDQDRAWSQDLLRHPKERAEHVMLLDLERSDLGRVCRAGSVQVKELMALESYRHVHHIVSEIRGELREGVTPAQVIRAVFPGGTITGCPKVRCMQIIAELEHTPRMAYTGSMGYINRDGSLDLNILIRTLVQNGSALYLRAGAGIVADSIPERELAETRSKAKGMLTALGAV
ncbi:MAG: aminodeoxychorismate synthase component I [Sulfuricaulis sp.]